MLVTVLVTAEGLASGRAAKIKGLGLEEVGVEMGVCCVLRVLTKLVFGDISGIEALAIASQ